MPPDEHDVQHKRHRDRAPGNRWLWLTAALAFAVMAGSLVALGGSGRDGPSGAEAATAKPRIAVVLPERDELALVARDGVVSRIRVGSSPWGVAVKGDRAYVGTAHHVAIVDLVRRRVLARVSLRNPAAVVERGEYRAGAMGIAVAADGQRVYVGVHRGSGRPGALEVLDVGRLEIIGAVRTGERPFDVLTGPGSAVYTVDHDSYGVTAIDVRTLRARTFPVAPAGAGAFDKLNYGAVDARGRLLLPINGEVLAVLDPRNGRVTTRTMRSHVHQAGATLSAGRLLTVGAEALQDGSRRNLSVFDLRTGRERLIPLRRAHEDIAVLGNGRTAYLSGGYTRGGWDGVSEVDLRTGRSREIPMAGAPLGIAAVE